jgi:hypothetical protein
MLKQVLTLVFIVSIMVSTASAAVDGDTRIVTPSHNKLPNIKVSCGEPVNVVAELQRYGPKMFILWHDPNGKHEWSSLVLRYLELGVFDSKGNLKFTDQARTKFINGEAHFDKFKLDTPGVYTCYIKYSGDYKNCQTKFLIFVI